MKLTEEQVGELVDRFNEYLQARKRLNKCYKQREDSPAYFCQSESDARDAALTALTSELNAVLPSEFTAFERDQREAQERTSGPTLFALDQLAMLEAQERAKKGGR